MTALAVLLAGVAVTGWLWRARAAAMRRAKAAEEEAERLRGERRAAEVRAVREGRVRRG